MDREFPIEEVDSTNGSTNKTSKTEFDLFYFYEAEQLIVLWILLVTILIGNVAILFVLSRNRTRKSRMNYFVKHLAIADLGVGFLSVLTDLIWHMTIEWHGGDILCRIVKFLQITVTYASVYILVSLSIDRYYAVIFPMRISGSYKRAKLLIITAWALSAAFSMPSFYLYEEKLIGDKEQCWIEFEETWQWQLYMVLVFVSLFFMPLVIIVICYSLIIKTIWSKRTIPTANATTNGRTKGMLKRASSKGLIPKARIKTLKIAFAIVSVFILCWSPYFVFDLLQVFGKIPNTQTMVAVATFIQSLAPLNSAANPFVYLILSTKFCKNFWRSNTRKLTTTSGATASFTRSSDLASISEGSSLRSRETSIPNSENMRLNLLNDTSMA